jgi:hypothetical protein
MISDEFDKMDGYLAVCKLSDVDEWKLKRQGKAADVKSEETKIYMPRNYWRHCKEGKEDVLNECRVYKDLMSGNVGGIPKLFGGGDLKGIWQVADRIYGKFWKDSVFERDGYFNLRHHRLVTELTKLLYMFADH